MIVPGAGSERFAASLAAAMGAQVASVEARAFPDGERYVRVDTPLSGHVVAVQTAWPPQRMLDALLVCDASRRAGAETLTLVVPYLAYSRQDRVFRPGEALSAEVLGRAVSEVADRFITVEPHKPEVLDFFGPAAAAVEAAEPMAAALKQRRVDCVLAPDKGARERAADMAGRFGADFDHLEKTRIDGSTVRIEPKSLDVAGRRVAVVDDMISTGGTMATALAMLSKQGASATFAVAVHGLFVGTAETRLLDAGAEEIVCADTVPGPHAKVGVAEVVAAALAQPTPEIE